MAEPTHKPLRPQRLTAKGAATRERIVRAAAELMHTQGVERTSLDDVIAVSGTGRSQLYHYFADKAAIVDAVVEFQIEQVLGAQEELLRNADSMNGLTRWRDAVVAHNRSLKGAHGCPLGSLASALSDSSEITRQAIARGFDRWEGALRTGLQHMRQTGALAQEADPATLATGLLAALQGGYLLAQARRDATSIQVALDTALDHIRSFTR
ncbi:TetR/AcrR family transcriptional regulator [Lentzea cavernae]|uniref:Transcriptional regulator n=1 Tax=Lentzea cavernae TaxID=2020703 RepID=A0ABQ3MGA8_9PSEU|nr:TetR/AcrR family transcriptional regulator [Lentzea cavernae]GHH42641.1 transcriptional regulator [Lentzea cavernae]